MEKYLVVYTDNYRDTHCKDFNSLTDAIYFAENLNVNKIFLYTLSETIIDEPIHTED